MPAIVAWMIGGAIFATGRDVRADEPARLPDPASRTISFDADVAPLLRSRCLECHGAKSQESAFRVDQRESLLRGGDSGEAAVVVGKSADSPLVQRVAGLQPDHIMPPDGPRLTAAQVAILRAWIDHGANWGTGLEDTIAGTDHWSLKPIVRATVPRDPSGWSANAIDCFILEAMRTQGRSRIRENSDGRNASAIAPEERSDRILTNSATGVLASTTGLTPSPRADRRTLLRRLHLDVLGLPPSPEELAEFLADDRPDAWERAIDRVLASPHYGERWARHWLDIVRFAETDGFEMNQERPNAWRYRDWVIDALNDDMPYDRFVAAQIAGDAANAAATGFLVGGAFDKVKSPDIALTLMQRQDELADVVNTTGTAFLGLTLGCARCHNHKFDPVTQKDYYALQAVFAGVQHGERPLPVADSPERRRQVAALQEAIAASEAELKSLGVRLPVHPKTNEERFAPVTAKFVRFTISGTNTGSEPCLDEIEVFASRKDSDTGARNVALAALGVKATASGTLPGFTIHQLTYINDGRHGNSRSWISNTPGKGWVTLEFPEPVSIDRIVWGRDREEKFTDRLPTQYVIETAVEPDAWTTVATSADRLPFGMGAATPLATDEPNADRTQKAAAALAKLNELKAELARMTTAAAMTYGGRFEQPGATHRLYRGDPMSKREEVVPDTIAVLHSLGLKADAPEATRREALARWLTDPSNPLTARVIANRVWQFHFGRGLVATPSDFGKNGVPPTHPELLDWLAAEGRGLRDEGRGKEERSASSPFVPGPSSLDPRPSWSLKHLHRLILTSNTYQQSSAPRDDALAVDADCRFLWRFPPRRLEAEVLRDATLAVSGALDTRMGGPGFSAFEPNANYVRVYNPREITGPAEWRRMVYMTKVRMHNDGVFGAFDCPDAGQVTPQRTRSTTPLQALNLLNSTMTLQQAGLFAARVDRETGGAANDAKIRRVFQLAFGREPDDHELAASDSLVSAHGLTALCRAVYNANEFLFLP